MSNIWRSRAARCSIRIDYNYPQMKASGYVWPVIDLHLRYVASATFGQRLKLRAEIVEWENRLKIDYLISDAQSGRRLTRASTTQVAVEIATGEMCFVSPPVLFERIGSCALVRHQLIGFCFVLCCAAAPRRRARWRRSSRC